MTSLRTHISVVLLAVTFALTAGCGGSNGQSNNGEAADDELSGMLNAAHILISHNDSERPRPSVVRTREEALELAQEVAKKAQAEGADFAALAAEYSDGPSAPKGGNLGNFLPSQMVPAFSGAVMRLAIGEVSDPAETKFGIHIILRKEVEPIKRVSARQILIQYQGAAMASPDISRTKEEALALAEECLKRLKQGEKFEDVAMGYSDGPAAVRGGDLSEVPSGKLYPAFEEAAFGCEVGELTEIFETPAGYHILYRYE